MDQTIFINECRISLDTVHKLIAIKYPIKGLSSKHKRFLERSFREELQRIAIFEGDLLFCLIDQTSSTDKERSVIKSFLGPHVNGFHDKLLQPVTLRQLPPATVERLVFAVIQAQAESQGIYKLRGRTFFQPSKTGKQGQFAVETNLVTEDNSIKLYLVPTLVVLTEIDASRRSETVNAPAIGLCSFSRQCAIADINRKCKLFTPGYMGFVAEDRLLSHLSVESQESFTNFFEDCPQIDNAKRVISIKATKGAKNVSRFPAYAIQLNFTDIDFSKQQKASFRDSTLMSSSKRWSETNKWINRIFFGSSNEESPVEQQTTIEYGGVSIPISFLLDQENIISATNKNSHKPIFFPDQKIVTDQQNPIPSPNGGGYQFRSNGAYDRNASSRPFNTVSPFLILPNEETIVSQTRKLMNYLADGYSPKEYIKGNRQEVIGGDKEFVGLNKPEGQKKYNVKFINPWDEEDYALLSNTSDNAYLKATEDVIREWNVSSTNDPNRMVIVIKPPETSDSNSPTLYHDLKSRLDQEGIPNQFITFDTLANLASPKVAFGPTLHSLWLNIYAKMGGTPWRIESEIGNVHCFIGIGFGLNPSNIGEHIYAGVAHIFDKYGNWVNVASDSRQISSSEYDGFLNPEKYIQGTASFKISQETTESIVYNALSLYKDKQNVSGLPPQNIVLHKLGPVYDCEVLGFLNAIKRVAGNMDMCRLGILQIEQDHLRRLYGRPISDNEKLDRTVFRGTGLVISHNRLLLATTGRGNRYYFGIGTPNPLLLTSILPSPEMQKMYRCGLQQFYDIETLGKHVMALTQLHWGSTKDNVRQPITTLYAQKVAELVSKMGMNIDTRTKYHRPWFL